MAKLKSSWFGLSSQLQLDQQQAKAIFNDLVEVYSDCSRHYHNLEHIHQLLNLLSEVEDRCECFSGLQLTAWFHDYVYNPQANDNELKSALYAAKILNQLNLEPKIIELVTQIIVSTQKHKPLIESRDNLIFLDLDLAILGTSPDKYSEYAQQIRKEYSYKCDRDYSRGRKQILTIFLSRPKIYYTDYFYSKFEQQARNNIEAELNQKLRSRFTD